jgi:ABC-type Na+ efflux pump permease subunit
MSYIYANIQSTLLEAARSRVAWMALFALCMALGLAAFLHQVALTEQGQIQTAVVAALLRASAVFLVATFVITSMVREANDKVTELLLSQPVPRWAYFAGKFGGYALVGLALGLFFALPLAFLAPPSRALVWGVSLACELLVVAAVSLFCVMSLAQTVSAFAATAGFYLLARSIEAVRTLAAVPLGTAPDWVDVAMRWIVDAIALFMPSLDRMTLTEWLLETPPSALDVIALLGQTAVYVVLIAAAALFDLYRKSL